MFSLLTIGCFYGSPWHAKAEKGEINFVGRIYVRLSSPHAFQKHKGDHFICFSQLSKNWPKQKGNESCFWLLLTLTAPVHDHLRAWGCRSPFSEAPIDSARSSTPGLLDLWSSLYRAAQQPCRSLKLPGQQWSDTKQQRIAHVLQVWSFHLTVQLQKPQPMPFNYLRLSCFRRGSSLLVCGFSPNKFIVLETFQ